MEGRSDINSFSGDIAWSDPSTLDAKKGENNRMGKTRDVFKKIRDTRGTFHAKMGTIKDRNGKDLTEAEDTKKGWKEYTEELYKKVFLTQIITMV